MNKKGYILIILIILIFTIGSFLPYLFLKESRHYPLSHAQERIKKLYPDNDGDLLDDNIERNVTFTSTSDPDSDNDFFPDGAEYNYWYELHNELNSENLLPTGDIDNDGQTNILDLDSDGDGVPDGWEIENDLEPWRVDSDFDGNSDRFEFLIYYNFDIKPTVDDDNDLLPDYWENYFNVSEPETDLDGDGVSNINEWLNGSDPTVKDERYGFQSTEDDLEDSDFDGLTDRLETAIGTNPYYSDSDYDDLPDGDEYLFWSLPFNPDTDLDNITDGEEADIGTGAHMVDSDMDELIDYEEFVTDPTVPDSNRNLILDGDEFYSHDIDHDKLNNLLELDDTDGFTTDPFDPDTDGDGIIDGAEDSNRNGRRDGNDPTDKDSDWGKGGETDPNNPDTDVGGLSDRLEILLNLDPLDPSDDDIDIDLPEGPDVNNPPPQKGLEIDPWACLTWLIIILIILIALILVYYMVHYKKKLIDEVIDILKAGERELYHLETADEIRNAIFRTYKAFLNALTKFDLRRMDAMTVQEFAEIVRKKLPIRPGPVAGLTNVFEEARYSNHYMGIPSKNRAIKNFRNVRLDLSKYRAEYLKSMGVEYSTKTSKKIWHRIKKSIIMKDAKHDNPKNY